MSGICCNPDLFWELYAKILPINTSDTIKLLGSSRIRRLDDSQITELLKLSREKILIILKIYAKNKFLFLSYEDQEALINSIVLSKTDEIANDVNDCFNLLLADIKESFNCALIISRSENAYQSSACLDIIKTIGQNDLCFMASFKNTLKLLVSSQSIDETFRIHLQIKCILIKNRKNIFKNDRSLENYLEKFNRVEEEEDPRFGSPDNIRYLEELTDKECPSSGAIKYSRIPGRKIFACLPAENLE